MKGIDYYRIERKSTRIPAKYYLSLISVLIFIIFATSGYTGERASFISLGLCLIWFIVSFLANPNALISIFIEKKVVVFMLFLLFYIITSLPTAGIYNTFKYIGTFIVLFSPMFIFSYYKRLGSIPLLKKLLYSIYLVWFVFALLALRFYYENPGAARRLVANREAFGDIAIGGGYPLAIGSAIIAVFLLDIAISNHIKKKFFKFILYLSIIILFLVVIETRSTITLLGLIFGLLTSLLIKFYSNKSKKNMTNYRSIFTSLMLFSLILIIYMSINSIGQMIMSQTTNSDNALFKRLYEVGLELAYIGYEDGGSNYLWGRLSRLSDSFIFFLKSPFVGVGYEYGYDFYSSKQLGIGNHSEWFDILAVYGLFGGIPLLSTYYHAIMSTLKYSKRITMVSFIFVVIFLGLFNPFKSFQAHLIIFFVIPSSYILLKKINLHGKEG